MRTFRDAKAMAKSLRTALAARGTELSHSESLELVAAQFERDNWNILAAKIAEGGGRPQLDPAVPILRIFDVAKAIEFYVDFLGFGVDWEHRFEDGLPLYMQVSRSEMMLHLSEHHGDGAPGAAVFVWMSGIKEFHRELLTKDYSYAKPGLGKNEWDDGALSVVDPFGNTLRFSERLPS